MKAEAVVVVVVYLALTDPLRIQQWSVYETIVKNINVG